MSLVITLAGMACGLTAALGGYTIAGATFFGTTIVAVVGLFLKGDTSERENLRRKKASLNQEASEYLPPHDGRE
jgi:hypothetical protein